MATETVVRTYRDSKVYMKDAERFANEGWTVQSVATQQPRAGCGRMLAMGPFAFVFKPKPEIIVTYVREI